MTSLRRMGLLLAAALAPLVVGVGAAPAQQLDPRQSRALYADPQSLAAQQGDAYAAIGSQPQALWLTTSYSVDAVQGVTADYVSRAAAAQRTPQVVLYAIPDLNCGGGGWPDATTYRAWVSRIAAALAGRGAIAIVEPDALPFASTCGGSARLSLLRWTVGTLAEAGVWAYLDAGHTHWQPAKRVARWLKRAGVARARGFALNVANFQPTAATKRYAAAVRRALAKRGVRASHYVIDTSRNGARPRGTNWCNPTWARLGTAPRMFTSGALDGLLWVKHPGETDGACHGGPAWGWSDLLADRLLGR
ncbi:MAG: glycoside hydrolase family 6 protein [Nocardioides sp.]|uniref:glycoside hydrolase family 6 protein n=1 Tax=Nocardioides sp. TaxID=35761 RepID=UPI0039E36529